MESIVSPQKPRGYSYFEDGVREFEQKLDWDQEFDQTQEPDQKKAHVADGIETALIELTIDKILKGEIGRRATVYVSKWVSAAHRTPTGRILVDNIASASLGKSVQGAAAISHVSKIIRSHGLSNCCMMIYNDTVLVRNYRNGELTGAELGKGLFVETLGQGGDMVGWMLGASLAASVACPPYGAVVAVFATSVLGRWVGSSIARLITGS